jgi:RHS repeat-associated protein
VSEFDSLGRRLATSEPGTSTRHSSYDEDGNEIMSWWQDGSRRRVSTATYDGFGRVTGRKLSSVASNGVETIESNDKFYYDQHSGRPEQPQGDLRGRLSWAETTGVGSVFYGYDVLGRSSSTSYLYQSHSQLVREATTQAPGGRTLSLTLTTPLSTDAITYEYDSAERMRRVRRGASLLVDAQIVDAKGRPGRVVYGNGAVEAFDYAPFGREELLSWSAPGHLYEYLELDGAGRLRFERDTTTTGTTSFGYEHDALGRLSAMAKSTGGIPGVETYTHDALGNMLTRTATTGVSDLVYQRDVADPDRMCRIAAPGGSTACNLFYDGAGNVVSDTTGPSERRFVYDAGQRITSITRGSNEVTLVHGPVGRARTRISTPAGKRDFWHFGLIEERKLPGKTTQIERKIPGPLGVTVSLRTQQIERNAPTHTVIYAHGDGRANRVFTGDNGAIVQSATYGTYGQTSTTGNSGSITYTDDLWNSGDNLPEVGVTILGPRAYDPELGRFLQRDPIRVALRASTANPYSFAFSNPVDFSDPTGLSGERGGSGGGGGSGPSAGTTRRSASTS